MQSRCQVTIIILLDNIRLDVNRLNKVWNGMETAINIKDLTQLMFNSEI